MGLIYIITNSINNKKYVGKTTKDLSSRIEQHLQCVNDKYNKYHLHYAIEKYGWENFFVDSCFFPDDLLDETEKKFIREFDTFKKGYNMTLGGEGATGRFVSKETRKKMSKAAIKRFKDSNNHPMYGIKKFGKDNPFYGKKHSEETKKLFSKIHKEKWKTQKHPMLGKKHSKESRIKMSTSRIGQGNHMFGRKGELNPNSKEYIIIFPEGKKELITGIYNFCRKNNLDGAAMIRVAKGKQRKHKGFKCVYKEN